MTFHAVIMVAIEVITLLAYALLVKNLKIGFIILAISYLIYRIEGYRKSKMEHKIYLSVSKSMVKKSQDKLPTMEQAIAKSPFKLGVLLRYKFLSGMISRDKKTNKGIRLLDVGCADGLLADHLHDLDVDYIGVDMSPRILAVAKEKRKLNVLLGDAEELPFRIGALDYVASSEVLEHLHDPKSSVKEMKRVCKVDGKIIVTTKNASEVRSLNLFIWLEKILSVYFPSVLSFREYVLLSNGAVIVHKAFTHRETKEIIHESDLICLKFRIGDVRVANYLIDKFLIEHNRKLVIALEIEKIINRLPILRGVIGSRFYIVTKPAGGG